MKSGSFLWRLAMDNPDSGNEKEKSQDGSLLQLSGLSITDLLGMKYLSKPLSTLIDTVSNHIGMRYEPTRLVRIAKAERKAAIIRANADVKVKNIEMRANNRLSNIEVRRQRNIESVVVGAVPLLQEHSAEHKPSEDWVYGFFNNCQDIGDSEMQILWSKILAGEIDHPGKFSLRTLSLVKTFTKEDAHLFTEYCSFVWSDPTAHIYTKETDLYLESKGIAMLAVEHLESIGLIHTDPFINISIKEGESEIVKYLDRSYLITRVHDGAGIPVRPLTKIGLELSTISGSNPDYDYVDRLISSLCYRGLSIQRIK